MRAPLAYSLKVLGHVAFIGGFCWGLLSIGGN